MQLVRYLARAGQPAVGVVQGGEVVPLRVGEEDARTKRVPYRTLSDILEDDDPANVVSLLADPTRGTVPVTQVQLLPPIDRQEVWAAGVTYRRSQTARMAESTTAADVYDRVYDADRPELFFKATPNRVVGPGQGIRIRADSQWSVPEPELALVLNSKLEVAGFTIGNDVSSRDIEGANPLYLPQAKIYDHCCALGPGITLADSMPVRSEIGIGMVIRRGSEVVFQGETSASELHRSFDNMIEYLGRDNTFPDGVFLLTGTGIVPDEKFTLQKGDVVELAIDGIGLLINPVIQL